MCEHTVLFAFNIDYLCATRYPCALDMRNIYQGTILDVRVLGLNRLHVDLGGLAHWIQAQARHSTQLKLPPK